MIGIIRFVASMERNRSAVVKIIIPERIETEASVSGRSNEPDVLGFVFGNDHNGTFSCTLPRLFLQFLRQCA